MHLSRTVLVALVATTTSALPVNESPKVEQRDRQAGFPLPGQSEQQVQGNSQGLDRTEYQGQQGDEHMHSTRSSVMETGKAGFLQQDGSCASQPDGSRRGGISQRCVTPPHPEGAASMPWKPAKDMYAKPGYETFNAQVFGAKTGYIAGRGEVKSGMPMINSFVDPTKTGFGDAIIIDGGRTGNQLRSFPIGRPTGDHSGELYQMPPTGDRLFQGSRLGSSESLIERAYNPDRAGEMDFYNGQPQPQTNIYYQPTDGKLASWTPPEDYSTEEQRGRDRSGTLLQVPRTHHAVDSLYEKQPLSTRDTITESKNGMGSFLSSQAFRSGSGEIFANGQQPRSDSWFQGLFGGKTQPQQPDSLMQMGDRQGQPTGETLFQSGDRDSKLYEGGDRDSKLYEGDRDSKLVEDGEGQGRQGSVNLAAQPEGFQGETQM